MVRFDEVAAVAKGAAIDVTVVEARLTVTVDVRADEAVAVAVCLTVDEAEADGRLDRTLPASTGNGFELPRVLLMHALVDELPGPQQKDESCWNG